MSKKKIFCVVGARPNFIKISPIMRAFASSQSIDAILIHTGQHYGDDMSDRFFTELGISPPHVNLQVGSSSHAVQTAEIMRGFDAALDETAADAVLVVGDVNSTIACALVATKRHVPVIHVEAGLRSFDRTMPEEINRVLTDQISDLLLITEAAALDNLRAEGIPAERIRFVGNVMIDTLHFNLERAVPAQRSLAAAVGEEKAASILTSGYALLTMHRPGNVDDAETLRRILEAIREIAESVPVAFPVHPRTRGNIDKFGLAELLQHPRIAAMPPASYLEILGLLRPASLVLTDSGGLQEESTALAVPCLTLRPNSERMITVTEGTNRIVGNDPVRILRAFRDWQNGHNGAGRIPPLWDGHAASRIVKEIEAWFASR